MKEVNKTFFSGTWLPGLIFIWYLIVMSQAQCRRNILELAHIQINYLQCTLCIIHKCTTDHYQKKKDATDEPQSFENHITITCCYSS